MTKEKAPGGGSFLCGMAITSYAFFILDFFALFFDLAFLAFFIEDFPAPLRDGLALLFDASVSGGIGLA